MKRLLQLYFVILTLAAAPPIAAAAPDIERLSVTGGELLLEWRSEFSAAERSKLEAWLISTTDTVRLLHGDLPRPEIRIVLQRYGGKSAVPFARVLRDQPEGILFYINPQRPLTEFIADWTAYHELSHLFIPYPGYDDIWFSEGLASYYQNVLQFRAGLLSKDQAIDKLRSGFGRAHKDDRYPDLTLAMLSPQMRSTGSFMRVYWSGALYFLEADITLRRTAGSGQNPRTLDGVLQAFGACCLLQSKEWSGAAIARQFDTLAGTHLFVPLYEQYERSLAIPAYEPWLAAAEMDAILAPPNEALNMPLQ